MLINAHPRSAGNQDLMGHGSGEVLFGSVGPVDPEDLGIPRVDPWVALGIIPTSYAHV